jgi:hypothetical protein
MTKRFCIFVASATLALAFCAPAHAAPRQDDWNEACAHNPAMCAQTLTPQDDWNGACAHNPAMCAQIFIRF